MVMQKYIASLRNRSKPGPVQRNRCTGKGPFAQVILLKSFGKNQCKRKSSAKELLHGFNLLKSLQIKTGATGVYNYRYFYTYLHWSTL